MRVKLPKMPRPQGLTLPKAPSVVAKRAANNNGKGRLGLKNIVTDNDPMARNSDGKYP